MQMSQFMCEGPSAAPRSLMLCSESRRAAAEMHENIKNVEFTLFTRLSLFVVGSVLFRQIL